MAFVSCLAVVWLSFSLPLTVAVGEAFPKPWFGEDAERLVGQLNFGRKLRVAVPCCGIDGAGHALNFLKVPYVPLNVFDLEEGYAACLQEGFAAIGAPQTILNLGKVAGNLLTRTLQSLQRPVDMLCSGPPCPPWSGQGCRKGQKDKRASVFLRVLEWVMWLIHHGGLLVVILENVVGITQKTSGREPMIAVMLRTLRSFCPEFRWDVVVLRATDYMLPHTRVRVFLRGCRDICVPRGMPSALRPFGTRDIREVLKPTLPHIPRLSLSFQQRINLKSFEAKIKNCVIMGQLEINDIVIFPASLPDPCGADHPQRKSQGRFYP